MLTAKDIMAKEVIQLERGTTVEMASREMVSNKVGSLIVTAGGYPVGIVTETTFVELVASGHNPATTPIEQIMSSPLFSTLPEADVIQIANTMSANRIKKIPVIERQKVVGMITQTDIVKYVLHTVSELQKQYTQGSIGAQEFAIKSQEIFVSVPNIANATKQWHMRCSGCGFQFLAEERDNKLSIDDCPRCHGKIEYDPTPPM